MPSCKRIFDIIVYAIISTSIMLSIPHIPQIDSFITGLTATYNSLPKYIQLSTIFLSGVAIKKLLIYVGDYRLNHEFTELSNLKNIPLRYSILLSLTILLMHYKIPINEFNIYDILAIVSGIIIGGLHDIHSLKDDAVSLNESTHYKEAPIKTKKEDLLNRDTLIEKFITSFEINHIHTAAIFGDYGTGKTSLTYLLEQKLPPHYLICRINSWGVDPLQIQKTTIENIVERLSHETSASELKSIAHKFVSNLKGASTLGLDILSVFDSLQKDPFVQIDKIDNHLSRINKKMLIIIEDIDRHNQTQTLLSELLSLFDKLRTTNSIYTLITIGTNTSKDIESFTSVINRSIGYYEYIPRLNGAQAIKKVISHFQHIPPTKFETHFETITSLWSTSEENAASQAAIELLSYYPNIRELGCMINETLVDWNTRFQGRCNLNDLFFIKTLKKFHFNLYSDILNTLLSRDAQVNRNIDEIIEQGTTTKGQLDMLLYFFKSTDRHGCVQTIAFDNYKYMKVITDFIDDNDVTSTSEKELFYNLQALFNGLSLLNHISTSSDLLRLFNNINTSTSIREIFKYISILSPDLKWPFIFFLMSGAANDSIPLSAISDIPSNNDDDVNVEILHRLHETSTKCQIDNYERFIAIGNKINNDNQTLKKEWFNDGGFLFQSYFSTLLNEINSNKFIINGPVCLSVLPVIQNMKGTEESPRTELIFNTINKFNLQEDSLNTLKSMLKRFNDERTNMGLTFGQLGFFDDFTNAIQKYQDTQP